MPDLKRLSIRETPLLCRILPQIAKGEFLCDLQVLEFEVSVLSFVHELNCALRENGFGRRSQGTRAALTIILVRPETTTGEVQQLRILERNWLRVGFRRKRDEHFMNHPFGEITEIEYEVVGSS